MDAVQQGAAGIGHLFEMVEAHSVLVADPFKRHTGDIGSQYLVM
jgi:hypothetical protein